MTSKKTKAAPKKSSKKSYSQYCALAKALDVVGERWTLLIMRELVSGPKRFQDFSENLPGIGTNLLTDRLKDLEEKGFIQKVNLPPPARAKAYEMTRLGSGLGPTLKELSRWGYQFLGKPKKGEIFKPHWALTFLTAHFDKNEAKETDRLYEFRIGEEAFQIAVKDGRVSVSSALPPHPSLIFTAKTDDFLKIISTQLPFQKAIHQKKIKVEGEDSGLKKFLSTFGMTSQGTPSTWVIDL